MFPQLSHLLWRQSVHMLIYHFPLADHIGHLEQESGFADFFMDEQVIFESGQSLLNTGQRVKLICRLGCRSIF